MPRFAANLGFLFAEHDFLDRFAAARRAGFRAVEFAAPYPYPPEELAMRLLDNGLECVLANLPMGDRARGDWGIACRPERVDEFRAGVARAIAYAHALGVPKLNCICGLARPGDDAALLGKTLLDNVRFAAAQFKREGLELLIEPLNTVDAPGFVVPRARDAIAIIEEAGADNLGLQFDLYHSAMMGEDVAASLESSWPYVRHIQFADAPGRGEPGTGRTDFATLFALIDRLGYRGWVSAEYRPTRPTAQTVGAFLPPMGRMEG